MTSNIKSASIDEYGWRAVPVSLDQFLSDNHFDKSNTKPIPQDYQFKPLIPTGVLQENVFSFINARLPEQTVNHSMRVFLYGLIALDQHFPHLFTEPHTKKLFVETYFLTCMLHDIGTADEFLKTTRMSFDFKGAIVAMEAMRQNLAPEEQIEAVGEAIIRHQDLGETGSITTLGALIQLTTVFDNVGMNPDLIHKDTVARVCAFAPRKGWSGCFASTIKEETGFKPWCHSTHIDGFADKVAGNELMAEFE